jgi:hypothetical protein
MKLGRSALRVFLFCFMLVTLITMNDRQLRVQADAASTGKAIGTGINAAISAAFPGISTVINAIWPKGAENKGKNKDAATQATQKLQSDSTKGLSDIDKVTSDLDTITLFLDNCIVADDNIIAMRTFLAGKKTLSVDDKLQLNSHWNPAKGRLGNLKGAGGKVATMNDASLQVVLQAVVDSTAGATDNVTQEIEAGTAGITLLSDNLQQLDQQLSAVTAISGQVIQNISLGLKTAKNTAAGAQGEVQETEALKTATTDFADSLTKRYKIQ